MLQHWVRPKWGDHPIGAVKPFAVEEWLRQLNKSLKTKQHIKFMMHVLFDCAMRWELFPCERNPMQLVRVRGSGTDRRTRRVLTAEEFNLLLNEVREEPFRTMSITAMCLGLRVSELAALTSGATSIGMVGCCVSSAALYSGT